MQLESADSCWILPLGAVSPAQVARSKPHGLGHRERLRMVVQGDQTLSWAFGMLDLVPDFLRSRSFPWIMLNCFE